MNKRWHMKKNRVQKSIETRRQFVFDKVVKLTQWKKNILFCTQTFSLFTICHILTSSLGCLPWETVNNGVKECWVALNGRWWSCSLCVLGKFYLFLDSRPQWIFSQWRNKIHSIPAPLEKRLTSFSFLNFHHDTVTFFPNILDIIYELLVNHLILFCMHLVEGPAFVCRKNQVMAIHGKIKLSGRIYVGSTRNWVKQWTAKKLVIPGIQMEGIYKIGPFSVQGSGWEALIG